MGQEVTVKKVTLGTGIPKICVPVIGTTETEIVAAAQEAAKSEADLVEWRADFWENCHDIEKLDKLLKKLQSILGDKPLLFTIRTQGEGGQYAGEKEEYKTLLKQAANHADLVDVEVFMQELAPEELVKEIHSVGSKVVASNHEFFLTPSKSEIVGRLQRMEELGADIAKIAVMPQKDSDVVTLLDATQEMKNGQSNIPVITMSMAGRGAVSRISGEFFGSAVTFASLTQPSAPGQLSLQDARTILQILHENKER